MSSDTNDDLPFDVSALTANLAPVEIGPGDEVEDEEKVLNQNEVDGLLGFNLNSLNMARQNGIRAMLESAMVSYERLPMLEIVFDRLVRLLTTSLRNFTSENVEVSLNGINSVRFGEYLNSIPLPAMMAVVKGEEWDNYVLLTVESSLIYSMIDVLLGGRQGVQPIRVEGRPYTTIETNLVRRLIEIVLLDCEQAFEPVTPVKLNIERLETNPRFAMISRPANAAILIRMRIDIEERGGTIEFLIPYATIEPIRAVLSQMVMGEKFGRDQIWEGHLATEIYAATVEVSAVLYESKLPLRQVLGLGVGDTIPLEIKPDTLVELRCGDQVITEGRIGRSGEKVAVQVAKPLRRSKTTLAVFEAAARAEEQ